MDQIEKGAPRSARDARAPYPSTPVRQFSFTNFSTNNPTTPQPGNNLDSEYDRSNASTAQIITWASVALNTDGTLRDQIVGSNNLVSGLFDDVSQGIIDDVQPLVDQATAASSAALSSSHTAQAAATAADTSNVQAQGAATSAAVSAATASAQAEAANSSALAAQNYAVDAGNDANDTAGDVAICTDYGVLTQAWAEHMPDTIPPNILAVMGVTGDHWSSRWWANKAEAAFGSLTSLYLGVWPAPPTSTPTGDPIPIGAIYYDSTTQQPYVWDGTQWVPFHSPSKAYLLTLLYHATANQTTFPLTTLDLGGNSYTISTHTPEPIDVYVNGDRLPQDAPNPGYGYWNLDPATSTVTFLSPLTAGATVQIDIMAPPSSLAPSRVQTQALLDFNIDPSTGNPGQIDGVRKTFNLALADRSSLTVGSAQELFVSLDGVVQQPGTDFNTSSTTITFTDAPIVGARSWGMWYGPGLTGTGPGAGYLPISGGTLTGPLTLNAAPTLSLQAATKGYVDGAMVGGPFLPLSGGTLTGSLVLAGGVATLSGSAVQSLINALPATGGTVMLSPNTVYDVIAPIIISKPNVRLTAPSWATILRRDPAYSADLLIDIAGTGCIVEGFTLDGNSVVSTTFEIGSGTTASNTLIRRMQIINSAGNGAIALAGQNSRATGNIITGLGTSPSTQRGYGIWAANHQTVMIDGNIITGTGIDGVGFDGESSQCIGNVVSGCHCWTGGPGGQIASYYGLGGGVGVGLTIVGNTIGPAGSVQGGGIEAWNPGMTIAGNAIDSNPVNGISIFGIGTTVVGNSLRNCGGSVDALVVAANVTDFVIAGNRIADDRATPTMRYGISIYSGTSDRYLITGNLITGNTSQAIYDGGSGTNKTIVGNQGNAAGVVTEHDSFLGGMDLGAQVAPGGNSDLSKHIALHTAGFGFSVTANRQNYVAAGTGYHAFVQNGVDIAAINGSAIVALSGAVQIGSGGPTWTTGSAAPASTQPVGSLYSRVGGVVGATLYVSRGAGTWAAVAGV